MASAGGSGALAAGWSLRRGRCPKRRSWSLAEPPTPQRRRVWPAGSGPRPPRRSERASCAPVATGLMKQIAPRSPIWNTVSRNLFKLFRSKGDSAVSFTSSTLVTTHARAHAGSDRATAPLLPLRPPHSRPGPRRPPHRQPRGLRSKGPEPGRGGRGRGRQPAWVTSLSPRSLGSGKTELTLRAEALSN